MMGKSPTLQGRLAFEKTGFFKTASALELLKYVGVFLLKKSQEETPRIVEDVLLILIIVSGSFSFSAEINPSLGGAAVSAFPKSLYLHLKGARHSPFKLLQS